MKTNCLVYEPQTYLIFELSVIIFAPLYSHNTFQWLVDHKCSFSQLEHMFFKFIVCKLYKFDLFL